VRHPKGLREIWEKTTLATREKVLAGGENRSGSIPKCDWKRCKMKCLQCKQDLTLRPDVGASVYYCTNVECKRRNVLVVCVPSKQELASKAKEEPPKNYGATYTVFTEDEPSG
jgi:hypothetical protein